MMCYCEDISDGESDYYVLILYIYIYIVVLFFRIIS